MFGKKLREPFNAISHGVGAVLGAVGFIVLMILSSDWNQILSSLIYGFSLIFLYLSSALYHALETSEKIYEWFRKLDKIAIYTLIAGTATPLALIKLNGVTGYSLFTLFWGATILGIIYELFTSFESRLGSLIIYLGIGWSAVFYVEPLYRSLSGPGFGLCLAGGLFYTLGGFIYFFDWPEISRPHFGAHELWHLFCLAGSGVHYAVISIYVV